MKNKILIVDDQVGIRLLLNDVFSSQGYRVSLAEDGQKALEKIYNDEFDLIILDYHLPFLNGQEILDKMKQDQIFIPVILMSGAIENVAKDKLKWPKTIKVMAKPFNIIDMSEIVTSILETSLSKK